MGGQLLSLCYQPTTLKGTVTNQSCLDSAPVPQSQHQHYLHGPGESLEKNGKQRWRESRAGHGERVVGSSKHNMVNRGPMISTASEVRCQGLTVWASNVTTMERNEGSWGFQSLRLGSVAYAPVPCAQACHLVTPTGSSGHRLTFI